MSSLQRHRARRKAAPLTTLPLFAWADAHDRDPLTPGGRFIARRTGIAPRLADALALANGFGIPEASR